MYKQREDAPQREEMLQIFKQLAGQAKFLEEKLAACETDYIQATQGYAETFNHFTVQLTQPHLNVALLHVKAMETVKDFRFLQLQILRKQLTGRIEIDVPPAALSELVNEANRKLSKLSYFKKLSKESSHLEKA
ncbi:DUF2935 domain-containing protein [Alteribacillus sp. HJP-4]|uniref:DUF2935 domain-containing protein n=1 Tax=Alteribacillus sp. HJP-4 TaxID=2775394 RepID=UPI0035CD117E